MSDLFKVFEHSRIPDPHDSELPIDPVDDPRNEKE